MLCKGERIEFSTGSPSAAPTPRVLSYTPSNETFGTRTPAAPSAPAPLPAPKPPVALADLEGILTPSHGWSELDSQRQLHALKHCAADSPQATTRKAFDQSIGLGDKAFSKTGWAAGLSTASLIAGVGSVLTVFSNPGLALGLASGALAGAGGASLLLRSSYQDHNNGQILSDMGRRIDAKTHGFDYDRHGSHGNYTADFNLPRK